MNATLDDRIRGELGRAGRVLVVSHVRPDGDAVGSLLGLGLALQSAGRSVQMVLDGGLPDSFRHLPGSEQVRGRAEEYDYLIAVDCAERKRLGFQPAADRLPDLNIDHHPTNDNFARINLVEPAAVSTSAILAERLPRWGLEITPPVAAALLTGLLTDTIGFRTPNVTAGTLRLAADLMERGAGLSGLYMRALVSRPFPAARYWGAGLSALERQGGLAWATLTLADRGAAGYAGDDDADLSNILSAIDECPVVLMFVEQPGGRVKVSWRAQSDAHDVSAVARRFGGGGHAAAAGAELDGPLEPARASVIQITKEMLGL